MLTSASKNLSCAVISLVMILAFMSPLWADSNEDEATALKLFLEGRTLMKQGRYKSARARLEASAKLNQTLGTSLNLAVCYERLGKITSAWSLYQKVEELALRANDKERAEYARNRGRVLAPRLPSIVILVPYITLISDIKIARNGHEIRNTLLGESIYVDPGLHQIMAVARGYRAFKTTVKVTEGSEVEVKIPMLEPEPVVDEPSDVPKLPWLKRHRSSAIASGISVALLGAGLGLGRSTWTSYDALAQTCAGSLSGCSQQEIEAVQYRATATNVVLGACATAAATAIFLYIWETKKYEKNFLTVVPINGGFTIIVRY